MKVLLLIAAALLSSAFRHFQADVSGPPVALDAGSAGSVTSSPKREVPNYDGRGSAPTTGGDVLLWVPRVVLSPLYFVSEYIVRRPLAAVIPPAEKADIPRKVYDFFLFGPDHKAGVLPIGYFEFDFNPSFGVYAFWNDVLAEGNDWHLHAEAWPTDWYAVSAGASVRLAPDRDLEIHGSWMKRPDRVFYGIGPSSLQSYQSRYSEDVVEASALLSWRYWRESRIRAGVAIRSASFGDGRYGADPSLTQEAATGAFAIPSGFADGYTAEYNTLTATVDTHRAAPQPGSAHRVTASGFRLTVRGEQGSDVRTSPASGWIRSSAVATGSLDLTGQERVVSLSLAALFADPLGSRAIPFTENVSLGGDGPMRGYFANRLLGRSAAVVSLRYGWPVGPWLGGTMQAALGNVFDAHLEDFSPSLLRWSGAIGLSTVDASEYPIELIVGCGSETFAHGGQLDSVRISLSLNHGL